MSAWIIYLCVFGGVAALVVALNALLSGDRDADVEARLSELTGGGGKAAKPGEQATSDLMQAPTTAAPAASSRRSPGT